MRILHVLQSNKLNGAENVVADICMMFKNDYEMAYCSPDGPIRQSLSDRNVNFIPMNKISLHDVKKAINVYKPDLIHAHDVRATVLATIAAGRIPVISHLHGNIEDMKKLNLKSILYMFVTKKVKSVISVSDSILEDYIFRKQIEKKTICLKNIIYTPRIDKLLLKDNNEYDFEFAYLGRLTYPKNPQRVAKVAAEVLKQCPSVKFGVIGEGILREEMEVIFENEGVSDRVTFTGRLPYPYKALKQAKCMLMCSRYEGTPIAALEAMSLGVPIVSTPVDGMLNLVNHQKTGFLLSNDEELVQAILYLLADKKIQAKMSLSSVDRFNTLSDILNYKGQMQDLYNAALKL